MGKTGYVYILASRKHGTLYIGVTSDPVRRVYQHRERQVPGFTARHKVHRLVHIETFDSMYQAICREKQLKRWKGAWKIRLIEVSNPMWRDLYDDLVKSLTYI